MANGNTVTLVGNVTRDPELRFTPSGQVMASFGLAVNRVWNDRQTNERREAVSFFDIVCWREMAENANESLQKGARVLVTGRLEQRSWENQEGERRSKIEVIADEIGPSLRWATAEVRKNERRSPSGSSEREAQSPSGSSEREAQSPSGSSEREAQSPSGSSEREAQSPTYNGPRPAATGGPQGAPAAAPESAPAYDYGEEPF